MEPTSHSWQERACATVRPAPCMQSRPAPPAFTSETPGRASPGSPRPGLTPVHSPLRTGACATCFRAAPRPAHPLHSSLRRRIAPLHAPWRPGTRAPAQSPAASLRPGPAGRLPERRAAAPGNQLPAGQRRPKFSAAAAAGTAGTEAPGHAPLVPFPRSGGGKPGPVTSPDHTGLGAELGARAHPCASFGPRLQPPLD